MRAWRSSGKQGVSFREAVHPPLELRRLGKYTVTLPAPGVPAAEIVHRHPRFTLTLEVCPSQRRDTLLIRYALEGVPGVAEVASIGGFVKQYQVQVDPNKLLGYRIPLKKVIEAIRRSNNDVGGRVIEASEREYMVRGRGYIRSLDDIRHVPLGTDRQGTPIMVQDVGHVTMGPDIRRGIAELDGQGETVGGIVVMRYGENALAVIDRVKDKLKEITPSFPKGIEIVSVYDRSDLILRAIATLKEKLIEISLVVSACASRWLTAMNGTRRTAAIALPVISPTISAPIRPGPAVAATASIASKPRPASRIARAIRPSRWSMWRRAAISGTTPP